MFHSIIEECDKFITVSIGFDRPQRSEARLHSVSGFFAYLEAGKDVYAFLVSQEDFSPLASKTLDPTPPSARDRIGVFVDDHWGSGTKKPNKKKEL